MNNLICDDSIDIEKLYEDVSNMTDEDFEIFAQKVKETNAYPKEYMLNVQ